ncbi:MAG: DM13 domain-containing protein [Actinomycetota bacterium]
MSDTTLVRRFLRPKVWVPTAILLLAVVGGVLYWFEPQALFIDRVADEAAPGAGAKDDAMMEDDAMKDEGAAMMTLTGGFRSIDHPTSGTATLSKADDGKYYVRLEDFSTENGPDLLVYLSAAPATANGTEFAETFIDLGELKGNIGNQNYVVPDDADLEQYKSVVIWCRRFNVAFGAAPLEAAG